MCNKTSEIIFKIFFFYFISLEVQLTVEHSTRLHKLVRTRDNQLCINCSATFNLQNKLFVNSVVYNSITKEFAINCKKLFNVLHVKTHVTKEFKEFENLKNILTL